MTKGTLGCLSFLLEIAIERESAPTTYILATFLQKLDAIFR